MHKKGSRFRWPVLLLLLALMGTGIGAAMAKYVYQQQFSARVTFTARLAQELRLLESKAVATQDDPKSNYKLTEETVKSNTYELMPGVDIPKDPYVRITGKSPIPAYLFIEVVDQTNSAIEISLRPEWFPLTGEGIVPQHGGTVYYYNPGQHPTPLASFEEKVFPILAEDKVRVKQTYLNGDKEITNAPNSREDILLVYAYLYEVFKLTEGGTTRDALPGEVYLKNNSN